MDKHGKQLNKSRAEKMSKALFSNQQKIQFHFYRAHACFVKYFLMTKKLQQTKKLAYVTTVHLMHKQTLVD